MIRKYARRVRSRLSARERKTDTRRKILVGAMVLKRVDQDPESRTLLLRDLDEFLEHPRDRELFGLIPVATTPTVDSKS